MVVFYDERGLGCPDYSRLDYCKSLLAGVADVHLRRLQSVQNAAARLVFGARRHDHITPILATLHWLPVRERVTFKTTATVLVWKCLHDVAPHYFVHLCVPTAATAGRRQSRSAVSGVMLSWTRTSTGQLRCLWPRRPRYLEPTTMHQPRLSELSLSSFKGQLSRRPTSSSTWWLYVCLVPPSGAVATVVSSAPITNVPSQFNSTQAPTKIQPTRLRHSLE